MPTLKYTAIASSGRAFEMDFPLHPDTRSGEDVSQMMSALLKTVSDTVESRREVSDGDVLQALAMTMAVRSRVIDVDSKVVQRLSHALLDTAFDAAEEARSYSAQRQ